MANLRCHSYICAYNDCTHCNKEEPNVSENAKCVSFTRKVDNKAKLYDYEYAEDRRFLVKSDNHQIVCETTTCMNNYNHACTANHVRFDVSNDHTLCMNYRKKNY